MEFRINTRIFRSDVRALMRLVPKKTKRVMRDAGFIIEKAAVERAPKDAGNLRLAIHSQVVPYKKSVAAVVYVARGEGADDYAIPMHEHHYNLGPNSQDLQNKTPGVVVGRRYLARAVEDKKAEVIEMVREAFDRDD